MRILQYVLIFMLFLLGFNTQAQYTWEQVALPDTIGAGDICFFEDDIYLATGSGVYHSADNCETWEYIGLEQYPIWSIHVSDSGKLYAGTGWRFFRYAGNNEWDMLYQPDESRNILSIYESDSGYIFFGTFGGIYRSVDDGINWTEVLDIHGTESVESISENSTGILYAGSVSIHGDSCGVYKSEDGGVSWHLVGLKYHFVSSLVINSNDEIYAGTKGHWSMGTGRIYKSIDDAQNWDMVLNNQYIQSLSINKYDEVAAASETGIFCTYDGGLAWEEITPSWTGDYYEEVAFHPSGQLYAISDRYEAELFRTLAIVDVSESIDSEVEFKVFPNPTHDFLNIESYDIEIDEILISDLTGRLMKRITSPKGNSISIPVANLLPAVYIIHLKKENIISQTKFIKQ